MDIHVTGLWRGNPVNTWASVDLANNLDEQQKQVARLTAEQLLADAAPAIGDTGSDTGESAVDFATRLGFTKLDYQYQADGHPVVVDVLDPSKAI